MSDNKPTPPKGAQAVGMILLASSALFFAAAVGLVVLMIVQGSVRPAGIVLALVLAGCGGAGIAVGQALRKSRAH